jgi:hypothetical protein
VAGGIAERDQTKLLEWKGLRRLPKLRHCVCAVIGSCLSMPLLQTRRPSPSLNVRGRSDIWHIADARHTYSYRQLSAKCRHGCFAPRARQSLSS